MAKLALVQERVQFKIVVILVCESALHPVLLAFTKCSDMFIFACANKEL